MSKTYFENKLGLTVCDFVTLRNGVTPTRHSPRGAQRHYFDYY